VKVKKLEKGNNNMYDIVGMVGDQYIVKHVGWIKRSESTNYSDKGLKRVKIKASDNKRIGDQIIIEKL
jgi:hypothetical protein